MQTILVQASDDSELKMIVEFLRKHRLKSHVLTADDKEDIVLGKMMEETDYKEIIDTDSFLRQLRD